MKIQVPMPKPWICDDCEIRQFPQNFRHYVKDGEWIEGLGTWVHVSYEVEICDACFAERRRVEVA